VAVSILGNRTRCVDTFANVENSTKMLFIKFKKDNIKFKRI